MSKFVWFEYVSTDANKAQGFFGELFGWSSKKVPMGGTEYTMIAQGDTTIGGYMAPPPGAPTRAHWLSHLGVANAKESAAKVTALGGKVLMDAFPVGEHGTMAVVADPHGAPLALWQPATSGGGPAEAVGRFTWNELSSKDAAASVAFYTALGGFTVETKEMGHGAYHVLSSGSEMVAGIMPSPMPEAPHAWTPYVQVANTDASADRAKRLGATIIVPPTDVPNVGRFAVFADPQGAILGILQP